MSPNGIVHQLPPAVHPTVTVEGRVLNLRLTGLYTFLLDKWGVETATINKTLQAESTGRFALLVQIFAALVAPDFVDRHEPIPSPEYWAMRMENVEQQTEWFRQVNAVFEKNVKPAPVPETPTPAPMADPVQ